MNYDFTTIMDRRGRDAMAVDLPAASSGGNFFAGAQIREGFDLIPMWVADMNFPTAPAIVETMRARLEHPAFGYFEPRQEYYEAIINWHKRRYGVTGLEKKEIGYVNGVLGGLVSALRVLCSPGDPVLLQSPTYIGFTHAISDNGWRIVLNPMIRDEKGIWRLDFKDLEKKLTEHRIHAAVFCSPHNPSGRVWERWEIERLMELYKKHDVYVVSDEIWADLTLPGHVHIPTQSVSEDAKTRTAALYAPSKTFNLAGLVGAYQVIYSPYLRRRVKKEEAMTHFNEMNVLSMYALIGAYSKEGEAWLEELRQVLDGNLTYAVDYIKRRFHGVEVEKPQGTYMLFLDCAKWCAEHGRGIDELYKAGIEVGVIWQDGRPFHGDCHIRMNLALPRGRVEEAFSRLDRYVFHAPKTGGGQ